MNLPAESPTRPDQRIPALDGLRGIAILMVVFWHYYSCVPRPEWVRDVPLLETLAGYGWTGVPLFFTLSGFLIGKILVRHRGCEGYYRVFYVRRAARLLPLYFIFLILYQVTTVLLPPADHPPLSSLLKPSGPFWSYPVFLQNIFMARSGDLGGNWLGVSWSLAVEEQFYLLLPFLVAVVRPAILPRLLVGLVVFGISFRYLILSRALADPAAVIVLLPTRIDGFALGILAGLGYPRQFFAARSNWFTVAGIGICIAIYEIGRNLLGGTLFITYYQATAYTLIALIFSLVLRQVRIQPAGRVSRYLGCNPLIWVGSVSYFVYLFHEPVNRLLHYMIHGAEPSLVSAFSLATTLCAFGIVLCLGSLSRRFIEQPMIQFGHRFAYGPRRES